MQSSLLQEVPCYDVLLEEAWNDSSRVWDAVSGRDSRGYERVVAGDVDRSTHM